MTEAGHVEALRRGIGEALGRQCRLDDRREVAIGDMHDTRPGHQAAGEQSVLVGLARLLDAVGGHQDRTGELVELGRLLHPGTAVVAYQMRVLLQFGIAVGRQHLTMGIDVDALALGLLEKLLEVLQVMAGDQDGLARHVAHQHLGRQRVAIGAGVGRVEQGENADRDLAALQVEGQQFVENRLGPGQILERLVEEGVNGLILLAEDPGVGGIGRRTLDAVGQQFLQTGDILAEFLDATEDSDGLALADQPGDVAGRAPGRGAGKLGDGAAGLQAGGLVKPLGLLADFGGPPEQFGHAVFVEVDVGHRREQGIGHEAVDVEVMDAFLGGEVGVLGNPLGGVDQKILQGGDFVGLAADADVGAAGSVGGLFTLITKHWVSSFENAASLWWAPFESGGRI